MNKLDLVSLGSNDGLTMLLMLYPVECNIMIFWRAIAILHFNGVGAEELVESSVCEMEGTKGWTGVSSSRLFTKIQPAGIKKEHQGKEQEWSIFY